MYSYGHLDFPSIWCGTYIILYSYLNNVDNNNNIQNVHVVVLTTSRKVKRHSTQEEIRLEYNKDVIINK